jgi:hypothetical protein
VQELDD